jgi:hypothetical protein
MKEGEIRFVRKVGSEAFLTRSEAMFITFRLAVIYVKQVSANDNQQPPLAE